MNSGMDVQEALKKMDILKEKIVNIGSEKSKLSLDIETLKSNFENFIQPRIRQL